MSTVAGRGRNIGGGARTAVGYTWVRIRQGELGHLPALLGLAARARAEFSLSVWSGVCGAGASTCSSTARTP